MGCVYSSVRLLASKFRAKCDLLFLYTTVHTLSDELSWILTVFTVLRKII